MKLEIERLSIDEDDGMLSVEIRASNARHATRTTGYAYPSWLVEFGEELRTFPRDTTHEAVLEVGTPKLPGSGSLRVRVFVRHTSRTTIEIEASAPDAPPDGFALRFASDVEAAAINELGRTLAGWARSDRRSFRFPDDSSD